MKRTRLILFCLGLLATIAGILLPFTFLRGGGMRGVIPVRSPSGKLTAYLLPFKGQSAHPLDGMVRVFVGDDKTITDKHQTNLPMTRETRVEWIADATPPAFRILDQLGTRMVWQVEGHKAVCVKGQEFMAPDPYAAEAVAK